MLTTWDALTRVMERMEFVAPGDQNALDAYNIVSRLRYESLAAELPHACAPFKPRICWSYIPPKEEYYSPNEEYYGDPFGMRAHHRGDM